MLRERSNKNSSYGDLRSKAILEKVIHEGNFALIIKVCAGFLWLFNLTSFYIEIDPAGVKPYNLNHILYNIYFSYDQTQRLYLPL